MGFHFEFWVELLGQIQPVRGITEKWCEDATLTCHSEWTSDDRVKTRLRCCGGECDVSEGNIGKLLIAKKGNQAGVEF
jgi:hypothetical protein